MKQIKKELNKFSIYIMQKSKGLMDIGSWKSSVVLLGIIILALFIVQSYYLFYSHGIFDYVKGTVVLFLAILLISGIVTLIIALSRRVPTLYIWATLGSFMFLCLIFYSHMKVTIVFSFLIIIAISLTGAMINWIRKNFHKRRRGIGRFISIGFIIAIFSIVGLGSYWVFNTGSIDDVFKIDPNSIGYKKLDLNIDNPAKQGIYKVKRFSYGSGEDLHRRDYGLEVQLKTKSVDGSAFVERWSWLRHKYLGFGPDKMPLNAQVYYPEGIGPFPLIIMAHGNHLMTDYSDTGYSYLGDMLASRGYIFVSVDHNFLNLSVFNDLIAFHMLKDENDARAWLLLQHIKQWERWNKDESNVFHNKIDMDNIALIGHSRGGEAVSIASAFNKLKSYPDNGNIKFDFQYNIKSLVAIAPTEGQYKPTDKSIPLKDVNYLLLQGAHDADVTAFLGMNQYNRLEFSPEGDYFKASVYIYGANHGQFNENWGRKDGIGLGNKLINSKQFIPKEEQQLIAKVLISSFLDSTLKGNKNYRKLFDDFSYAKGFLPNRLYINNYFDGKTTTISNFEEDININSSTLSGGAITGENLIKWREQKVVMKNGKRENSAVYLNWDMTKIEDIPVYTIDLPEKGIDLGVNSTIVFSIADGKVIKEKNEHNEPIDLTISITDKKGNESRLPLSSYTHLQPIISGEIFKAPFTHLMNTREPVFQHFRFDLRAFKEINSDLIPEQVSKISFVFDKTRKGEILIDDVGVKSNID